MMDGGLPVNRRRVNGTSHHAERPIECLSCGVAIVGVLSVLGSLRCHDCRTLDTPLDPDLVRPERIAHRESAEGPFRR